MKHLSEFINEYSIDKYEENLFGYFDKDWPMFIKDGFIDYIEPIYLYNDYKYYVYNDILETLSKTYDYSKFKKYLEDHFDEPKIIKDFKNNKLQIAFRKIPKLLTKIKSASELFGYKISNIEEKNGFVNYAFEPIYYNNLSNEINKMTYLYYCVPFDDNEYRTFKSIKESFKKKCGIKPSRREKKSKHFRRTYCFTEDVDVIDIKKLMELNDSLDHFILIRIKWKEYINDFHRKVEWFEDPNANHAVWTREIIPFIYLEFNEITNIKQIEEIIYASN